MKKKQIIKSLLQEPPISKDCLRNSHFLKIKYLISFQLKVHDLYKMAVSIYIKYLYHTSYYLI